jgi:hypothetical protein
LRNDTVSRCSRNLGKVIVQGAIGDKSRYLRMDADPVILAKLFLLPPARRDTL